MASLGVPELIILAVLFLPVVGLLALIDVLRRPESQFVEAGQRRRVWLIIAIVTIVVPCLFLASGYYLVLVRPKLARTT